MNITDLEHKVHSAALKSKRLTAEQIAQRAGLSRQTIATALSNLHRAGKLARHAGHPATYTKSV